MLNRFRYKYKIEHNHFIPSIGRITKKKVQAVGNKSDMNYHKCVKQNFDDWNKKSNQSDKVIPESESIEEEKCFLNLKVKKRRVIRCTRCLQQGHYYKTCENEKAPDEIKKDFKLTREKKRKNTLSFKIRRRQISKRYYQRNKLYLRRRKKFEMRKRRKAAREQQE